MDLTYTPPTSLRAPAPAGGRYLGGLGACLLGYALFSRSFAYVGVPPLFVGEVMLAAGMVAALRSGRLGDAFRSWPLRLWAVLVVWTVVRTVPYLGGEGFDALSAPRDAMLVLYGFYAVVVAAIVLADPDRLLALIRRYGTFVAVMLALAWLVFVVAKQFEGAIPDLPWVPIPALYAKGGDLMVHMTGIVAALSLGLVRASPLRWAAAAFSAGVIMVSNRGGMVAFALGLGLVWLMRPPGAGVGRFTYAFAALLLLGLVVGPVVDARVQGGSRDVSVEQVVENVKSVFGRSGSAALDGTRRWRMLWWGDIVDYTVHGPYFWTGKGFGINLAAADGYQLSEDDGLRSPHNGHLTVLARAGVPGAALWALVHLTWFGAVVAAWWRARRADHRRWTAVFAWLAGFWTAAMVNASFDVFLEGPMGAVWVWSMMGLGVAAVRLHAARPDLLSRLDVPLSDPHGDAARPPDPQGPAFRW